MRARRTLATLFVLGAILAAAPRTGAAPLCLPGTETLDRCEAWEAVYNNEAAQSAGAFDYAGDVAASPDGTSVFVTGRSWDAATSRLKAATVAYEAATGKQLWVDRYEGEEPENDYLSSAVVSPDGSTLYISGVEGMNPVGEVGDYLTIAYDAATGARLWSATYDSPQEGDQDEEAHRVAVSPDGRWVYVTGQTGSQYSNADVATVAYDAETGEQAWALEYSREAGIGEDIGVDLVATDDAVYVAGAMGGRISALKIGAGDPRTEPDAGKLLWSTTDRRGYGYWIALAPDGSRVYITGSDQTPGVATITPDWDYAALALDAATGEELWMSTYAGLREGLDVPYGHALSPNGDRLYVTGTSQGLGPELDRDYATVAFDTAKGTRLWDTRFGTPAAIFETGADVVVKGNRVYVSGGSTIWSGHADAITEAYDSGTGDVVWSARNNATPDRAESGWRAVIAGSKLVVAGSTSYPIDSADPLNQSPSGNSSDYLVFAYDLP